MLVLGIGNEFRCDDGVGPLVARAIRALHLPGVTVIEAGVEGIDVMMAWEGAERVIVVDALSSGAPAGTIYRLDASAGSLPTAFFATSSHAFGLAQAVEMARVLGSLPPRLVVYGVEGQAFEMGLGLTEPVAQAAQTVLRRVVEEVTCARAITYDKFAANHRVSCP